MTFWDAVRDLDTSHAIFFFVALTIAFGFEFINGFHDTANAVTTVIYSRSMPATPAVIYSGFLNFLGVLLGGIGVAFGIVNLLPVDLLIRANTSIALVMVLSLLLAGIIWNLGTWYYGLPVSSSHTLIGSILGVGLMNSFLSGNGINGVNWHAAMRTGIALLVSPLVGFLAAAGLFLLIKSLIREPRLYTPPVGDDRPPTWVRYVLILSCGSVSFAHGSNDGQKGMGLILLVLIGFLPFHYALDTNKPGEAANVAKVLPEAREYLADKILESPSLGLDLNCLEKQLTGKASFNELKPEDRWEVRQAIYRVELALAEGNPRDDRRVAVRETLNGAIQFVPFWVVVGVALALGIGTTIGYKRIMVTVAEKIGKTHLTYAQGASAEVVAAITILLADFFHAPVSTTQVLSSGVAGTMAANKSGIQGGTCRKILLAWAFTLPGTIVLSGILFAIGRYLVK